MKKTIDIKVILTSLLFILLLSFSLILVGCGDESSGKVKIGGIMQKSTIFA